METTLNTPPPFQNELLEYFVQPEQKVNVLKSWRATALAMPLHVPAMRWAFVAITIILTGIGAFFYYTSDHDPYAIYTLLGVYIFGWFTVFRQKTMYEYVLTSECCFARDRIHDPLGVWSNSAVMGGFLLILSVALAIVAFFYMPLASLGALALGIMATQSMRAVRNPYSYGSIAWKKVDHIIVDQCMQAMELSSKDKNLWEIRIYCPKGQLREILIFVQSRLPKPLPVWSRTILPEGYGISHKQTLLDEEQIQAL